MWKWIKFPKIGALVAFFLPWMTISCSGTPLIKATGWQLAFGSYVVSVPQGQQPVHDTNIWFVLAILLILAGIWLTFLAQSKDRSLKIVVISAAALILIWIGTARYDKSALIAQASKNSNGGYAATADQAAAMMIQITWEMGYWLTLIALIAAGVMACLVYSGRDSSVQQRIKATAAAAMNSQSSASSREDPPASVD